MGNPALGLACYLVEWYRPDLTEDELDHTAAQLQDCAASSCAAGSPVQLIMMLAVPTDEVIFGVVAARSAEDAAQACRQAGIPPQRLTVALDAHVAALTSRGTPDLSPTVSQ